MKRIISSIFIFFTIPSILLGSPEKISILVDVFAASEKPGKIDPGLAYIRPQIQRFPFRYQSYLSLASVTRSLNLGEKEMITFLLPQQFSLEITPIKSDKKLITLSLRMRFQEQLLLTTELSLVRNGTVMVGGPQTSQGTLIIAISEGW